MTATLAILLALLQPPEAPLAQTQGLRLIAEAVDSVYTGIADCPVVELDEETGASSTLCEGIAGYELLVTDEDARMSVTALDYWQVVTFAFSNLGTKAEWRVIDRDGERVPVALVVRVNASEGDDASAITSYLAVAKITPEEICVTDRIEPDPDMNAAARRAADTAGNRPCLPHPEE